MFKNVILQLLIIYIYIYIYNEIPNASIACKIFLTLIINIFTKKKKFFKIKINKMLLTIGYVTSGLVILLIKK